MLLSMQCMCVCVGGGCWRGCLRKVKTAGRSLFLRLWLRLQLHSGAITVDTVAAQMVGPRQNWYSSLEKENDDFLLSLPPFPY